MVCEPRGHDAIVGALLTPPVEPGSVAGVVFFNNAGGLGMCGHGLIGVVRTLEHLGRLAPGRVRIDTPVGTVAAELEPDGPVTIENVPARCHALDVEVEVPGLGRVTGDVAYGGNWFFLTELPGRAARARQRRAPASTRRSRIQRALRAQGITGRDGAEIDHVELFGPPRAPTPTAELRPLPGRRLRPLALRHRHLGQDGRPPRARRARPGRALAAGERSPAASSTGWLEERGGDLVPRIRGRAFVTGRATLYFDPRDPFREGFTAAR